MSRPSSRTLPPLLRRLPATSPNTVVLPAPLGPITPTNSPASIDRSSPRTTGVRP
jgi:hypothetical protein